ncbi:hypothetical protein AB0N81_19930 [Streptomyces sp. NPDC093510]|uniref:hypothetical protein n=1 Tax=Streptomyces sp. NPDC093510 TaxID=3155199 RepID=UPI00342A9345
MTWPALEAFTPEKSAQQLQGALRGHLRVCPDCRAEDCDEGARMRRAFRAVRSVLKPAEPPGGITDVSPAPDLEPITEPVTEPVTEP